jgi:hypothetical protein
MENSHITTDNAVENTPAQLPVVLEENKNEMLLKAVEASTSLGEREPAITLTAEYIQLEAPGESFRGIFIGFQEVKVNDPDSDGGFKTLIGARFVINKKVWINAGSVLVNEIKRASVPEGTPLEVTLTKIDKRVKIYEITLLA